MTALWFAVGFWLAAWALNVWLARVPRRTLFVMRQSRAFAR